MESQLKEADFKQEVLQLVKRLQEEEAQSWCEELDVVMDRIILMYDGEDAAGTLDSLKTLQAIKRIFKQFAYN